MFFSITTIANFCKTNLLKIKICEQWLKINDSLKNVDANKSTSMRANATFSSDLTSVNSIIRLVAEVIFKTWYNALDTR